MNDDVAVILLVDDLRRRFRDVAYDPVRGLGCIGSRVAVTAPWGDKVFVPRAMTLDPAYPAVVSNTLAWKRLRCRHDFEYWCATCAVVRLKDEGRDGPFILNAEGDRTAHQPIRLILLKARQWGGSTLVQMYMAWIQSCLRRDWNSLICAHVKDAASGIRGMYTKLLDNYPADLWDGDEKPQFASLLKGQSVNTITLEEALKLFEFPRGLGEFEGKPVTVAVGRFGPYVKHDGKFVSIPKDIAPTAISLKEAEELIVAKREAESKKLIKTFDEDAEMQILNGRYGVYIMYKKSNYKIPKTVDDPASLTYEQCKEIVDSQEAKPKKSAARKSAVKKSK